MRYVNHEAVVKKMNKRLIVNGIFKTIFFAATLFALLVLGVLFLPYHLSGSRLYNT